MAYSLHEESGSIIVCADGDNEKEAFQDGGRALFEIMTKEFEKSGDTERVKIVIDAPSLAKLFEAWLVELTQKSKEGNMVFSECYIATIQQISSSQYLLTGAAYGAIFDSTRHSKNHDVHGISQTSCERDKAGSMIVCCGTVAIAQ